MKLKKISLLVLSTLVGFSALHAVPTDPTKDPTNTTPPPSAPLPPPTPPPPNTPTQSDELHLTISDSGSTHTISLKKTVTITLPVTRYISWSFVQNVPEASSLLVFMYAPLFYAFGPDPQDETKMVLNEETLWSFAPQAAGPVTLSFYASGYNGELYPDPYKQIYTFTINVTE